MTNSDWNGSAEEWARVEQPLLDIDPIIDDFAREFGLTKHENDKDWPGRALVWDNGVQCLINLYLADQNELTFNLWLCASQDRGNTRFWKQETPIKEQRVEQFSGRLADELRNGRRKLIGWTANPAALEFATVLGQRPG